MAQIYADLRFAKVMGGRSMASQALEAAFGMNEAESPFENTQPALAGQDEDGAEPNPDWQVTRSLQDSSREHASEQGRLSQELRVREQSLEQTQLELAWAREELQRAWHEGNISQLELDRLNTELRRVTAVLGRTEREVQEVQGRLNNSESTVALLRSCTAIDCCPSGWLLYRGKCLFISSEKKTWEDSRDECEKTYSQLLVTKSWSRWTVPTFLKNADVPYWIGLQKGSFPWYDYGWLEEEDPEGEGASEAWFWVDGSLYERYVAALPLPKTPVLWHGSRKCFKSH
ncbi:hypothetical protein DV515_00012691 [Chloebia gouldiae]|uniref:C-type lectin domain-containing protein n=1 Tax=Chloebia gouldiae TaxID=44316 RepID=A0A3L8S4B2_CHLGU|nr:hypothetical protein DV515_00012691 [Chloebia gouldiae]